MEKKSTWNILALSCALVLVASLVVMSGCIESSKGKMPISVEIGEKYVTVVEVSDKERNTFSIPDYETILMLHQPIKITNIGKETINFEEFESPVNIHVYFQAPLYGDDYHELRVVWFGASALDTKWSKGGDIIGGKLTLGPGESITNELLLQNYRTAIERQKELKFKIIATYQKDEITSDMTEKEIIEALENCIELERTFVMREEDFDNPELRVSNE